MRLFHLLFATSLLVYFVWQARGSRIFLFGIPMLMLMAFSVFFDELKPFWMPGRLDMNTHIMIWLTIVWLICTGQVPLRPGRAREKRPFGPPLSMPEEAAVLAILLLTVISIALTGLRYEDMLTAVETAVPMLYLLAGYFMVRGIISHSSRPEVMRFIDALVVVNTLAAVLFIAHQGLHVSIYEGTEYRVLIVNGERLTRTFYFMPQLLILSLAVTFVRRRWNLWTYLIVAINLIAVWISYTRSLVLIVAAIALFVLAVRLLRRHEGGIAVRRLLSIAAVVAVVAVVAVAVFPTETSYFFERFGQTEQGQGTDKNLNIRRIKWDRTYEWAKEVDPVMGVGFASTSQHPYTASMLIMQSDIIWVPVLFWLGLAGVVAFAALYLLFALRAGTLLVRARGPDGDLWLMWLAVLFGSFAEGFVNWTLLNDARYPLGLWFFAVMGAEFARERVRQRAPAFAGEDAGTREDATAAEAALSAIEGGAA